MERINIAIIGGGASGLFLANALFDERKVTLFEKGERLGRKLSATGNGQGNLTNLAAREAEYFSVEADGETPEKIKRLLHAFDDRATVDFFASLGVLSIADERGRVYPSSRQASALTDALRYALQEKGTDVRLQATVTALEKKEGGFLLRYTQAGEEKTAFAEKVVLCAGGKAAKNFGTDGKAYALATALGHRVTNLYPSLVQLKTDVKHTKTLKGIRVNDGVLSVKTPTREEEAQGDIIFTDYGVSGDTVFRLSAFIAAELSTGEVELSVDFLPRYEEKDLYQTLLKKRKDYPFLAVEELLFGVVNNQVGRAIIRRANGDLKAAAKLIKSFPLTVTGSLGFDYAQVTKGGIPFSEVTDGLESRFIKGLYFAGEILDVDGQCGGFNLQWAFASARAVALEILKEGGQVCV